MKKIFLLSALWLLTLPLFSQNAVNISGVVTDINTGAPLPACPVTIQSDSVNGFYYYHVVYTNPNGYFQDLMVLGPAVTQGIVHVSVIDCQQYTHTANLPYSPGNMSVSTTFSICAFPQGCTAAFTFNPAGPLTMQFIDQSVGANSLRNWDFGDGTTSNLLNPVHTFPVPGYYVVSLSIGAQGTTCWDQEIMTILVGDSVSPGGCQSYFISQPDPANSSLVHFLNQSIGNIGIFEWDFGDGSSQTVSFPANPNVDHLYAANGTYTVCLSVHGNDTLCNDIYCTQVIIGQNQGCQANFNFFPTPGVFNTIQFGDNSIGNVQTWTWEFGDGTSQTITYPQIPNVSHTYANSGFYTACLNILTFDSCSSTICSTIPVGDSLTGCQALFTYVIDSLAGGNVVHFTDISSGNPTQWLWNFGDGTTSTLQNPTHTFVVSGSSTSYFVNLIISGSNCTSSYQQVITVYGGQSCQAFYTYAPVPGASPNVFQFTDASVAPGPITWFWNFDDGTVSTEQNPLHVFPAGPVLDPYFVCLTISSGDSMCTSTYCMPVLPQNQGCQAAFEALPAPNALLTMNFVNQSQGNIWMWTWDFGDGTVDTILAPANPNISHSYQVPGFYNVCLTVQGDYGLCNSTTCHTVPVYDSLPPGCQAQFTYFPDSVSSMPNAIKFVDLSLGTPTQWFWDFGDPVSGILNTSTLQNPVHAFSAPGNYTVCLTIGGPGCQSVWCGNVEVGANPNCVNYFTYSQIGLSVNFEGHILNNTGGLFAWDFGDNQTGFGENIVHNYSAPGTYFVTLTTTTGPANACTYTSTQIISVGDTTLWGQLYGQVFAGNFPVTQGMVFLFSLDTNGIYVPFVDISMIDSSGVYVFPMVPQGNYVIYAIPFANGYIPTYYGNVLNWQNATVVQLGTPNNPYNINLIQSNGYPGGSGTIGGQISQGDFSGSMVDKVTMLLKDSNGNTILYSQVNEAGNFEFPQLAYGTYYLYAELAGCASETIQVIISEANPTVQVNLTLQGNSILGRNDKQISLDAGVVYPNPVKQDAQIIVKLNNATDLFIEVYNMTGQMVYTKTDAVNPGETTLLIPASQFMDGIYMLKIYTRDGLMLNRKLVKSE